jgi:16S rRNA (cytidine1402-2'-O)-methyltransferase
MDKQTSLFIVPTPIGNLEDITLRAIRILKEVDHILAEDTRTSAKLLRHFDIRTPYSSYHSFNEHKVVAALIDRMKKGETFALISDAGTPGISDPGFLMVRECLRNDLKVECLPGATAFVPALIKSGFPSDSFVFEGFLPHKKGRKTKLDQLQTETRTIILYESPHRLKKTLDLFKEFFGPERLISVSRELTKVYEETINGTLEEVAAYFSPKEIKGEIVIVIAPKAE